MKYKGYTGVIELDEDSEALFGRVIGLRDVITFQADSVPEVIQAFHDSVDVYLEFCAARGERPEKPYSGQFVLRVDPQLHRAMAHTAEVRGTSLNALIEGTLERVFLEGVASEPLISIATDKAGGLKLKGKGRSARDKARVLKGSKGSESGKAGKR
jgi:predicted HicB family RNase H-like nuclease